MASQYILKKRYSNYFGVDLRSNDLTRDEKFASQLLNAQYRKSGTIEKRRGYQAHASSLGGFGLFTYNRVDPTTAVPIGEVITISDTPYKLSTSTLDVVYSGGSSVVLLSIFFDPEADEYKCQILDEGTVILDESLGKGFDEASTVTIDDLRSAIDALTDFAATVTGSTTTPAAFIEVVRDADLIAGDYSGQAQYWSSLNTTISTPMSGSSTNKNDSDFENISSVQLNNVIYFSNGYDEVYKYDGQTFYRAGVPSVGSISSATGAAGSLTGTYTHAAQYIQYDNSGNVIEGNIKRVDTAVTPSSESVDVTVSNIEEGTGFNTNCAIVDGNQSGVTTITVDDGSAGTHTMQVGDTAYFYDGVSSSYVEREITAIAATTITIAGAAVDVLDNAVISNNLRIGIYRNQNGGTTLFLVEELPNNSFTATQVYNDDVVDASLVIDVVEPLTDRSPPKKGKYISAFRNQMVTAGSLTNPNTVSYSDVDGPEYFPAGSNEFIVETEFGDIVTGIAPNNELFAVFKEKSIFIVSGNIAEGTIRVDLLTQDIGCAAHATIKELRGSLAFLSDRGPYVMTGGQIPTPLGDDRIEPVFDGILMRDEIKLLLFGTQVIDEEYLFQMKRATAINDRDGEKYLLYVPAESTTLGNVNANANSRVFSYDYNRDAWLIWDNINASGGFTSLDEKLFFQERKYSDFEMSVESIMHRFHNIPDAWAYEDNDSAINFEYYSHWEALGEPSVLKRFTRLRHFSIESDPNNSAIIAVDVELNYVRDVSRASFTVSDIGGGYGVSAYGTSPYGNPAEAVLTKKLNPGRSRSMRIKYSNSEHQANPIIPGWEIECAAPFNPRFKK